MCTLHCGIIKLFAAVLHVLLYGSPKSPGSRAYEHLPLYTNLHLLLLRAYRNNKVPQPFASVPLPQEVEYLNDIRVYDTQQLAWHGVRARGKPAGKRGSGVEEDNEIMEPEGRYGASAALISSSGVYECEFMCYECEFMCFNEMYVLLLQATSLLLWTTTGCLYSVAAARVDAS